MPIALSRNKGKPISVADGEITNCQEIHLANFAYKWFSFTYFAKLPNRDYIPKSTSNCPPWSVVRPLSSTQSSSWLVGSPHYLLYLLSSSSLILKNLLHLSFSSIDRHLGMTKACQTTSKHFYNFTFLLSPPLKVKANIVQVIYRCWHWFCCSLSNLRLVLSLAMRRCENQFKWWMFGTFPNQLTINRITSFRMSLTTWFPCFFTPLWKETRTERPILFLLLLYPSSKWPLAMRKVWQWLVLRLGHQ